MNYKKALKLFNTRAKGKLFKVLRNGSLRMYETKSGEMGAFLFKTGWRGWSDDQWKDLALLEENDNLTLLREVDGGDNAVKNSWCHIAGFGTAYSDTTKYKHHKHRVRFRRRYGDKHEIKDVPFAKGLKVCTEHGLILVHAPDLKMVMDRAKAKTVYDYVREVGRVMMVTARLAGIEYTKAAGGDYDALNAPGLPLEKMDEDSLGAVAEAAWKEGRSRRFCIPQPKWLTNNRVTLSDDEYLKLVIDRTAKLAMDRLRDRLKRLHGEYHEAIAA